jgi:hypothetical protein
VLRYEEGGGGIMAKEKNIKFQAALLQSSPNSKPIKFNPEGGGEIVLEFDASQKENIKKFIGMDQVIFEFSVKEVS